MNVPSSSPKMKTYTVHNNNHDCVVRFFEYWEEPKIYTLQESENCQFWFFEKTIRIKEWKLVLVISKTLKTQTIILWHVLPLFAFLVLFCFVELWSYIPKLILPIGTLRINKKQVWWVVYSIYSGVRQVIVAHSKNHPTLLTT